MRLDPGYYKVSRGSGLNKSYHLIRVWVQKDKKFIQYDYDFPREVSEDEEKWFFQDHRLEEVYGRHKALDIQDPRVIVEFKERGTPIRFKGRSIQVLKRILMEFPRLYRALGGSVSGRNYRE